MIEAASLVRELESLGCRIEVEDGLPKVSRPANPRHARRFAELLPALKAHRAEVLAYFETQSKPLCPVCRSGLIDPEDQERMAGVNFLCNRGLTIPARWSGGAVVAKKHDGCPYRRPEWRSGTT